jgi:F-type H+-transporting ATPase subunit b
MATNTSHGTEVPSKGGFPAFRVETFGSQLLWLAIAFGLLYYLMSRFIAPRIGGILEERASRISDDVAAAQAMKAEADAATASYEKALAEARANAQAIAAETRASITAKADAERKALEDKLAADLATAESTIAAARTTAMGNVRTIAVDATKAIVERLAGTAADASRVEAAVDAALKA